MAADPDIFVDLTTAGSAFEADVMVQALRAQGIPAEAFNLAGSMLQWDIAASQPFRVSVLRRDVARAREALKRLRADSVDLDWDEVDTGAPDEAPENPHEARTTANLWRLLWGALGLLLIIGLVIARSRIYPPR
jgi:hypothetical protein